MKDESLTYSDYSIFYGVLNDMRKAVSELRQLMYFYELKYTDNELSQFVTLWDRLSDRYKELAWGGDNEQ